MNSENSQNSKQTDNSGRVPISMAYLARMSAEEKGNISSYAEYSQFT